MIQFFSDFYSGFAAGPLEIVLLILLVLVFVVGLTVFYVVLTRREREKQLARARQAYRELADERGLTPSDEDAIEVMSRFLNAPEKKYMLLRNESMYNACAESAVAQDLLPAQRVSALRVKLGFVGKRMEIQPDSSAQLPPGASVLLIQEGRPSVRGTVAEPQPGAFRVHVEGEENPFPRASTVEVLYQNSSGLYTFRSKVQAFKQGLLYLTHAENPERVQRRRFYRRNISLPVYVRHAGAEEGPVQSRFYDLGGGGASLENPGNRFRAGAGVELTFHPDSTSTLNVLGNVVRTSHRGTVIHVNFEHLKESTRDRIYRMLFSKEGQAARRSESEAEPQHPGSRA